MDISINIDHILVEGILRADKAGSILALNLLFHLRCELTQRRSPDQKVCEVTELTKSIEDLGHQKITYRRVTL